MRVVKRDGRSENVMFDKITSRIQKLCYNLDPIVNSAVVAQKVISGVYDGGARTRMRPAPRQLYLRARTLRILLTAACPISCGAVTTVALDDLAAETAAYLTTQHPDYARLAARVSVSNLHKMTEKSFSKTMDKLYRYVNPRNGQDAPLISDDVHKIIQANADRLDAAIIYDRDFEYDYFGFKTLEKSYLLKCKGKVVEQSWGKLIIYPGDLCRNTYPYIS